MPSRELTPAQKRAIGYQPCALCGRGVLGGGVCSRCERERNPTPVSRWLAAHGMTLAQLADEAGLATRTAKRALHGEPMSAENATRIHRVTGIPVEELTDV